MGSHQRGFGSVRADGRASFGSDNVCLQVVPVAVGREIEIDPERDVEVDEPGR